MKSFRHSGRIGDVLYSLPAVRELGGGTLFLSPNEGLRFSESDATSTLPLLEAQPYVAHADLFTGQEVEVDLDAFRNGDAWRSNLADAHLFAFGLSSEERDRAWLEVAEPKAIAPVVFARSLVRRGPPGFWGAIYKDLSHSAVFVGSVEEHRQFERLIGPVPYHATADLLDLAQVIAGADLFVGNQSAPYAIAEGLKKTVIQETYSLMPNCVFQRPDALLVRDGDHVSAIPFFAGCYAGHAVSLPRQDELAALDLIPGSAKRIAVRHPDPERGKALVAGQFPHADIAVLSGADVEFDLDCVVLFGDSGHASDVPRMKAKLAPSGTLVAKGISAIATAFLMRSRPGIYDAAVSIPPYRCDANAGRLGEASGPGCSVVVVTYNSHTAIGPCLRGVLPTLRPGDEIIVVDNGSSDRTVGTVRELLSGSGNHRVVEAGQNLGFSAGCNVGIEASKGSTIVLLNPDTTVRDGWLESFEKRLEDRGVGAVGPVTDHVSGHQFVAFHLASGDGRLLTSDQLHKRVRQLHPAESMESKLLIGFCIALRREVLDEIGLLDDDLFLGGEDLELSLRLRLNGYKLLIARDVFVHHTGGASFGTVPEVHTKQLLAQSTEILHRKIERLFAPGPIPTSFDLFGTGILPPPTPVRRETYVS